MSEQSVLLKAGPTRAEIRSWERTHARIVDEISALSTRKYQLAYRIRKALSHTVRGE